MEIPPEKIQRPRKINGFTGHVPTLCRPTLNTTIYFYEKISYKINYLQYWVLFHVNYIIVLQYVNNVTRISASNWCALQEALCKCIDTIQHSTHRLPL